VTSHGAPRRPRVVAVTPDHPWPPRSGGTRRVAGILEALAREVELHVVVVGRADQAAPHDAPVAVASVTSLVRARSRVVSAIEMVRGLPSGRPLAMAHYTRPGIAAAIAAVCERVQPDVVLASWLGGARLVDGVVEPARVLLDLDNAEHQRFASMARTSRGLRRALWRVDAALIRRWMARRLPGYAAVALASATDVDACAAVAPRARYLVVENGVDLSTETRPDPGGGSLLLLGDLRYAPNGDALDWFTREILPDCPSVVEVRVVGGGDASDAARRDRRITPVGFVPDVAVELARATALVAPLRAGAGTRLKLLEAMASGVPIVSTTLGAAGLEVRDREHLLLADAERAFAAAVEEIIGDPELRARLSRSARALVEERHGWERCVRPLVGEIRGPAGA
jgi:glycosyltransferase involved in cell wall biosynthesis